MYLRRLMERVNGERGYAFLVGWDVVHDGEQGTLFGHVGGRLSPDHAQIVPWDEGDGHTAL